MHLWFILCVVLSWEITGMVSLLRYVVMVRIHLLFWEWVGWVWCKLMDKQLSVYVRSDTTLVLYFFMWWIYIIMMMRLMLDVSLWTSNCVWDWVTHRYGAWTPKNPYRSWLYRQYQRPCSMCEQIVIVWVASEIHRLYHFEVSGDMISLMVLLLIDCRSCNYLIYDYMWNFHDWSVSQHRLGVMAPG